MPRYHYNFRAPDGAVIDEAGAEFATADAAYEAAVRTARTLMASDSETNWLRCVFEVADASGEVVFELPFTEAVEPAHDKH